MQICRILEAQLEKALELVSAVFWECDREDFEEMGVQTFKHFIRYENMQKMMASGELFFFGAYKGSELVGVIAMREGFHISLLFVKPSYQRQGVGRRLVRQGTAYCLEKNPELRHITVNASPKGTAAYLAMGFYPLMPEQKRDGMRFTPMRIDIER